MDEAVHDFFTQTLQDAFSSTGGFTKSDHPVTPTGKHMRTRIEASPIPTANPSPKKRAR